MVRGGALENVSKIQAYAVKNKYIFFQKRVFIWVRQCEAIF